MCWQFVHERQRIVDTQRRLSTAGSTSTTRLSSMLSSHLLRTLLCLRGMIRFVEQPASSVRPTF